MYSSWIIQSLLPSVAGELDIITNINSNYTLECRTRLNSSNISVISWVFGLVFLDCCCYNCNCSLSERKNQVWQFSNNKTRNNDKFFWINFSIKFFGGKFSLSFFTEFFLPKNNWLVDAWRNAVGNQLVFAIQSMMYQKISPEMKRNWKIR